jgi:hypothetical protein
MAYNQNRRAATEGALAPATAINADPDCDNINFANYKGIYAENNDDQKYTCPITGAHFEFNDVCRRIKKVIEKRKPFEEQLYGKNPSASDDFTVSMLSVSDEIVVQASKQGGIN